MIKEAVVLVEHQPTVEAVDADRPLSLLSGRLRNQWHGMSRTGTVARLFKADDEPLLSMNPDDLEQQGLRDGELAEVDSRRDRIVVRVRADDALPRGRAWLPMHWGSQFMNSAGVNALTLPDFDPLSKQPELKHAAVSVRKAALPWPLVVLRKADDEGEALALLARARALLTDFAYASVALYGRAASVVVFRAALAEAPPEHRLQAIDRVMDLAGDHSAIVYDDPRRGISKRALVRNGELIGVRLAGETLAQEWLKEILSDGSLEPELVRWAVAPLGRRPGVVPAKSRVVCQCADVSEAEIVADLGTGATLATLQAKRKCGTFCGSCLPELRQLIARQVETAG